MAEPEPPLPPLALEPRLGADADGRTLATARLVLDITTAAAGERELDAILHAALDRLRGVVAFTGGSIAVVDGEDLVIRAAIGPFEKEALGQRLARGPSQSWRVIESLEAVRIDDLLAQGRKITGERAAGAVKSWLAVPIERRGLGIGLLEVDSTVAAAFSAEDEALVRTIGRALAGPVDLAARYVAEQRAIQLRDAFTGVISHELRTPITTIYGMSHVLRQRHTSMDPDALHQAIEDIEGEADRLRRLAEDLLILSRAEGGQLGLARDPLVLSHIVRRAVDGEAGRWPGHRFEARLPPGLPLVLGEELYVGQVMQNLLSNAAKYSLPGTEIEIESAVESDGVTVRVFDEGDGLAEETLERLFELFYRAPAAARRAPGAGIGLFVCRELIEGMGGRIWARPRAVQGAEFGFWLPALHEEPEA
jgi:signal transduction histidine kinase